MSSPADGTPAPPAPGATTSNEAARWEAAMRGLQSKNFTDREAAQKTLDTATWRDAETLRTLAEKATDAEVKARLESRLEAISFDRLVHPLPITLDVKNAGIKELAAALTTATGTEWTAWERGAPGGPWNLKAEERPLWEIFTALEKQSAAHVQNSGGKVMLMPGPMIPGGVGPIDGNWTELVAGDFLIYVGIARGLWPTGSQTAGAPKVPTVKLVYGVRGDPRLRLVRCSIPDILSVVDENGKELHTAQPQPTPTWIPPSGIMSDVHTAMGFDQLPGMGKKLTIKGQIVIRTATSIERFEIPQLTTQTSAPILAGGRTWQMWAINPLRQEGWVFNVTEQRTEAGIPPTFVPISVNVLDADGKEVWDAVVEGQTSTRVQLGTVKRPLKAVFLAAKDSKDVIVPFEFKDVPVPRAKDILEE